jgi:hypothetical protein
MKMRVRMNIEWKGGKRGEMGPFIFSPLLLIHAQVFT